MLPVKKLDLEICRKLREEGHTYQEIADYFKVSRQAVFDLLDKSGVKGRTKYSKYYPEWEELYKKKIGITTIAKKYNCSEGLVYNYLKKKFVMERGKIMKERGTQKPVEPE